MSSSTLSSINLEAKRLTKKISDRSLKVKLLGGLAVWMSCPSAELPGLARNYGDLDFISPKKEARTFGEILVSSGYVEDKRFNAIHGATRLIFLDEVNDRPIDVLIDDFKMCHSIELKNRINQENAWITPEDLLLTKLQIVSINEKDFLDIVALLLDQEFDLEYLSKILGNDWGFEKTVLQNLIKSSKYLESIELQSQLRESAKNNCQKLISQIENSKKSLNYKLRAKIGDKLPWYDEPEELVH